MDVSLEKKELLSHLEETVKVLADRLRDPKQVESTVINKISTHDIEEIAYYYGWSGSDLGNGFSGICCLIAELDKMYPNEEWDIIGHTYLLEIKSHIESKGIHSLSLWGGLTGICFATLALSKNGTRYQNFLEQLHHYLLQNLPGEINRCMEQISKGVEMTDYDVIGGLAGIGRYLVYHKHQSDMRALLDCILQYLVILTEDKEVNGVKVPGWYISSENQFLESEKIQYPNGNFNLGFAHGITGCLSLLSIAKLQGCEVEKQDKAISTIANWLVKWSQEDDFGPLWPKRISWQEHALNKSQNKASIYEAWCYGEVGIARSLWLAGMALENEEWKNLSLKTFTGMYHRSKRQYTLISPTYCHGIAGTLHSVQLMLQECPTADILAYREFLLNLLLQHIDIDTPFGAKDIEIVKGEQYSFDKPGLLSGSAGIAMVLLQAISKSELEWDSVFLVK